MALRHELWRDGACELSHDIIQSIRSIDDETAMRSLIGDFGNFIGAPWWALITHEDLREWRPGMVDIRHYPEGASRRIIDKCRFRRDVIMRGSLLIETAATWTELFKRLTLDEADRIAIELGWRENLIEGVTVPCAKLGYCFGSCTFAGFANAGRAELAVGPAQTFGLFAFARARQLSGAPAPIAPPPRLKPSQRDCLVLSGRSHSNKEIAHRLGLTERTVESYLRDACRAYGVRTAKELRVAAVLAGEIGIDEIYQLP
nr:helix-turn-helix transcriptional regulator [Sphingomonas sp. Y57]